MDERLTPWPEPVPPPWVNPDSWERGGEEYAAMHLAERELLALLAGSAPPPQVMKDVTARLQEISAVLAEHQTVEYDRIDGLRPDLPGRGHGLLPAYFIETRDDNRVAGRATFSRFYLGGNNAAHGGSHTLLFDDVLGHVVNHGRGVARTAYLTVNYRKVTPLDVELTFDATVDRVEGRKRFASARLFNPAGDLVADADGLFIELLPHHD